MTKPPGTSPLRRLAQSRVIVVLPAYNEAESLGLLLPRLDQAMHEDALDYEIVVVDDGSTDGTASVAGAHAEYLPLRLERHDVNRGLGATIRDGLKRAIAIATEGDIIVVMDADNTHPPGLIGTMIRVVREGADVVIASRYRPGSYVRGVRFHRKLLSLAARALLQTLFPLRGVRDYTSGYRAYRARVLRDAFERYGDDLVDQEGFQCVVDLLLKLRRRGLIFREVPLILRYDFKHGASKMNVGRTVAQSIAVIVKHRLGA